MDVQRTVTTAALVILFNQGIASAAPLKAGNDSAVSAVAVAEAIGQASSDMSVNTNALALSLKPSTTTPAPMPL